MDVHYVQYERQKGNHEAQTIKIGCANASVKTENKCDSFPI